MFQEPPTCHLSVICNLSVIYSTLSVIYCDPSVILTLKNQHLTQSCMHMHTYLAKTLIKSCANVRSKDTLAGRGVEQFCLIIGRCRRKVVSLLVGYLQPHVQFFYTHSLDTVTTSRGEGFFPCCVWEFARSVVIQLLLGGKTKALQVEINGVICPIFSLPNRIEVKPQWE